MDLPKLVHEGIISFFFQAEDSIRAHCVTGVQTCALPISMYAMLSASGPLATCLSRPLAGSMANPTASFGSPRVRSEERRVGKGCRCGWCADTRDKRTKADQPRSGRRSRDGGAYH